MARALRKTGESSLHLTIGCEILRPIVAFPEKINISPEMTPHDNICSNCISGGHP
jgi:hypothetical protein